MLDSVVCIPDSPPNIGLELFFRFLAKPVDAISTGFLYFNYLYLDLDLSSWYRLSGLPTRYRMGQLLEVGLMTLIQTSVNRLVPLEASRGIAATIVLAHHYFLAFIPDFEPSIIGRWYYVFVNGTGAVHFFFVLSGFVLCQAYFNAGDLNRLKEGFFKRLPRLAGPVLLTTIASFFLFYFGLYFFEGASVITGSAWLASSGLGIRPNFMPTFYEAVRQGLSTFITGDANFNVNLWTMKPEFLGSMVVYMTAAFISVALSFQYVLISFILIGFWAIGIYSDIFPFVAGLYLSVLLFKHQFKIKLQTALLFIFLGVYLLGYAIPNKDYRWVRHISIFDLRPGNIELILHSIASCLIIFAMMANSKIFQLLNGKFCNYLGVFSFPLYLVHTLVICSFGSYAFMYLSRLEGLSIPIMPFLFGLILFASILASIPLIVFDRFWLNLVNQVSRKIFRGQ